MSGLTSISSTGIVPVVVVLSMIDRINKPYFRG